MRWRRLSVLANGSSPPLMLLEDVVDLCRFYEYTERTIPRHKWAVESIAAVQQHMMDRMF